jgi:polyisoprenoid-binding protein YceI
MNGAGTRSEQRIVRSSHEDTMTTQNWNIDSAHSGVAFSIVHMLISRVRGRFASYSGSISLDAEDIARSSVNVSIDASSIEHRDWRRRARQAPALSGFLRCRKIP